MANIYHKAVYFSSNPALTIGGYECPVPSEMSMTLATFVDSGRNVKGKVVGKVVRQDVVSISAKWRFLSPDAYGNILDRFTTSGGGSFYQNVRFCHPRTNGWVTRKMYVADRTVGVFKLSKSSGKPIV